MASGKKTFPDLFEESPLDPMRMATGRRREPKVKGHKASAEKKKAGFYLSVELLDRFTRKFHELKLAGAAIENKSALVEMALSFAMDDMDKGKASRLLKGLQ